MTSKRGNSHKTMTKNPRLLQEVELDYEREHPLTLKQKFELFEQTYQLAIEHGGFLQNKGEEDLEDLISMVKAMQGNKRIKIH